jgi:hypothetical protein
VAYTWKIKDENKKPHGIKPPTRESLNETLGSYTLITVPSDMNQLSRKENLSLSHIPAQVPLWMPFSF